jgi:hypothetical protein
MKRSLGFENECGEKNDFAIAMDERSFINFDFIV